MCWSSWTPARLGDRYRADCVAHLSSIAGPGRRSRTVDLSLVSDAPVGPLLKDPRGQGGGRTHRCGGPTPLAPRSPFDRVAPKGRRTWPARRRSPLALSPKRRRQRRPLPARRQLCRSPRHARRRASGRFTLADPVAPAPLCFGEVNPEVGEDPSALAKLTYALALRLLATDVVEPGLALLDGLVARGHAVRLLLNDRAWFYMSAERRALGRRAATPRHRPGVRPPPCRSRVMASVSGSPTRARTHFGPKCAHGH